MSASGVAEADEAMQIEVIARGDRRKRVGSARDIRVSARIAAARVIDAAILDIPNCNPVFA